MIVLSGVLVLVALVLLVVGIVGPLWAVYASIVASLAAAVLLAVAVYTRRGAPAAVPSADPEPAPATGTTWLRDLSADREDRDTAPAAEPPRVVPPPTVQAPVAAPVRVPAPPEPEPDGDIDRIIWVIDERPLYHRQGCQHLSDGEPIPLDVEEAREDGFVPCPVCRPDDPEARDEDGDEGDYDDGAAVPAVRAPAQAADVHVVPPSKADEPVAHRAGGSVPVGGGDVPAVVPPAAPAARGESEPALQQEQEEREQEDREREREQEQEQEREQERERVRVALPAPPLPEEAPTGLVGRLLRRHR